MFDMFEHQFIIIYKMYQSLPSPLLLIPCGSSSSRNFTSQKIFYSSNNQTRAHVPFFVEHLNIIGFCLLEINETATFLCIQTWPNGSSIEDLHWREVFRSLGIFGKVTQFKKCSVSIFSVVCYLFPISFEWKRFAGRVEVAINGHISMEYWTSNDLCDTKALSTRHTTFKPFSKG